jgi:Uma2 family endonuclease
MSTSGLVSVEEYFRRTEKPYCEDLDGVLFPKAFANEHHGLTQYLLVRLLRRQGVEALSELTVRLSDTKYLIPDVIAARTLAKCELYHAWGVPFCWIVDPQKQTAWQYHAGGEPERIGQDGVLQAGELSVRLEELFSEQAC